MAITTAMCTSFKVELLQGAHDFRLTGGDTFKLALIKSGMAGTYGAASTNYSNITGSGDEVGASGTYATGGGTLTRVDPTSSGTTAYTDFADISFTSATISADGCMIYNTTPAVGSANSAVSVHDFGGTKSSTAGTFTIQFPTADASNAIIRIA
jgi:hypothetical protein